MKAGIALIGVAALLVACGESTSNADAHTGTEVALRLPEREPERPAKPPWPPPRSWRRSK